MADRNADVKLRVYRALYSLNLSFANIVAQCNALRESGVWTRKYAHLYQSFAQELRAQINEEVADILQSIEGEDLYRFGKVRQAWEKEITDPDDVFLKAEERRKELAKQGRKGGPAKGKKAVSPAARIHIRRKPASKKGGA